MPQRYVVTTPIYYVNSVPHVGTALTTVAADVTARYARMRGLDPFFVTGTDENGTKVKEAAEQAGLPTLEFVDRIAARFRDIWDGMGIGYDDFIRTTEPRHRRAVQELFKRLQAAGYIYPGVYEGWYDVSTETYYKESELLDGRSPDGNPVRRVQEENFFFRLSAFGDRLLGHIEAHPEFILPAGRRNEVVSFIRQGLRDVCVTRLNHGWGIPVPGDEGHVVYVWFDALINYLAASGWPDAPDWESKWPADVQWMGKDILTRFHATLWPAMLMGAELPLPRSLAGHAWLLLGGEKISKSKGNVVAPLELAADLASRSGCAADLAVDAVRYSMCRALPMDSDSTFSIEEFDLRYNVDLANDLGNALNRSLSMAHKFVGGTAPGGAAEPEALAAIAAAKSGFSEAMESFRIDQACASAFELVRFLNRYIDARAPWALAKASDPALGAVVRSMLLCLRAAEGLLRPVMPHAADAIAAQLGSPALSSYEAIGDEATLVPGTALSAPRPIFPRLELEAPKPPPTKKEKPMPNSDPAPQAADRTPDETISIAEFAKVKLRIGRIFEAEPVPDSDKLMKLTVIIGEERRQIVAGIRAGYRPEELIGRQVVVCVNLKPATLRGVESQGMLLAATDADGTAILLQPEREAPEGASVK